MNKLPLSLIILATLQLTFQSSNSEILIIQKISTINHLIEPITKRLQCSNIPEGEKYELQLDATFSGESGALKRYSWELYNGEVISNKTEIDQIQQSCKIEKNGSIYSNPCSLNVQGYFGSKKDLNLIFEQNFTFSQTQNLYQKIYENALNNTLYTRSELSYYGHITFPNVEDYFCDIQYAEIFDFMYYIKSNENKGCLQTNQMKITFEDLVKLGLDKYQGQTKEFSIELYQIQQDWENAEKYIKIESSKKVFKRNLDIIKFKKQQFGVEFNSDVIQNADFIDGSTMFQIDLKLEENIIFSQFITSHDYVEGQMQFVYHMYNTYILEVDGIITTSITDCTEISSFEENLGKISDKLATVRVQKIE